MTRIRIVLLYVFVFNIVFLPIRSQEYYDLNRCISTGLEKNYSILIAKNNREIASRNYTPGNAGLLPSIDVSGRYGGSLNNTYQTYSGGGDTTINNVHNTNANAAVSLNWTLFNGFSALTTYKQLSALKQAGELNAQMAVEDLIAEIASTYYNYIQQIQLYKNLEYAVSLSRERVRIDEERYLLGASSKLQLLQSQVYLNTDSSRYTKQKEVLRATQVTLSRLMALENLGEQILPLDSNILINSGLLYDSLLFATEKSNTSLLLARKNQRISEFDYKIISARTYPYLSLSSGYTLNHNKYESSNLSTQQTDGFNYGLTLGINVFDGFNQRREKAIAQIQVDNKEYQVQQIDKQVKADLITIYYAYENNLLLLVLEAQNLRTAQENLEIALERYKLGSLSGLELREVQQSLLEAEERLLSAQYQTKLAEISLLQISGQIMELGN